MYLNEAEGDVVRIVGDCPVFDVLQICRWDPLRWRKSHKIYEA